MLELRGVRTSGHFSRIKLVFFAIYLESPHEIGSPFSTNVEEKYKNIFLSFLSFITASLTPPSSRRHKSAMKQGVLLAHPCSDQFAPKKLLKQVIQQDNCFRTTYKCVRIWK